MINFLRTLAMLFPPRSKAFSHSEWRAVRRRWTSTRWVHYGETGKFLALTRQAKDLLRILVHESAEEIFFEHLSDPDPRVVVYCLCGLELLNSKRIPEAVANVEKNTQLVLVLTGSLGREETVVNFAKRALRQQQSGASLEAWAKFGFRVDSHSLHAVRRALALGMRV
jgi:hypothetical protein